MAILNASYLIFSYSIYGAYILQVLLSLLGLCVIGLALGASFGFCFYCGWFFADMHPIIPFLMLGIGVDNMFVIVKVHYSKVITSLLHYKIK